MNYFTSFLQYILENYMKSLLANNQIYVSYRSVEVTNGQCCHMSVLENFMNDV